MFLISTNKTKWVKQKKNLDEKTLCHSKRSSREFTPRVLFGAWETKVLETSFSPSTVIIHELFKPMTSSKLSQKEILYQVWRKSKTPTGWIQVCMFIRVVFAIWKKKLSDTVAAILILFSLRLAHHVPPSREDADMEDVCGIITCGLVHKFSK